MSRKTKIVDQPEESKVVSENERIEFAPVVQLENAAKVGFFTEVRPADDSMLEPLYRLCCESKDGDSPATILTPWCVGATLAAMVQGCMYLNPLLIQVIKDRQANAPKPEAERE